MNVDAPNNLKENFATRDVAHLNHKEIGQESQRKIKDEVAQDEDVAKNAENKDTEIIISSQMAADQRNPLRWQNALDPAPTPV